MGEKIDLFDWPVCNKFRPKMLEGQLCYQVDLNEVKDQVDVQKAIKHGMIVMMDDNEDKMITENHDEVNDPLANNVHSHPKLIMRKKEKTFAAKIYIETLGRKFAME